jgi:hypothetical protein
MPILISLTASIGSKNIIEIIAIEQTIAAVVALLLLKIYLYVIVDSEFAR